MSILYTDTDMPYVVEIFPPITPGLTYFTYRQLCNIRRTLTGNKLVDHLDVVGASPVGAAPTTSSFPT